MSIGTQFQSQDEDANARRVLTHAFALAQRLPAADASTQAEAGCALASTLARGGRDDLRRAQALVRESVALVPESRPLALTRAYCQRMAASVARFAGDSDADIAHTLEAQRVLQESGLGSELAHMAVKMELAEAYRMAGRNIESDAAFRVAFAGLEAMGRDRTERAGTLLNNWGLTLMFLGRPREADVAFGRALEISRADGSDASVSPMLLLNAQRPALDLGRVDDALAGIRRALVEARRLGDEVVELQATLSESRARRLAGDLDGARRVLNDAERMVRARLPPGHGAFAAVALQRSALALDRRDLAAARQFALDAAAIAEASAQGTEPLAQAWLLLAQVGVEDGHADDAVVHARRVLEMQTARIGAGILSFGLGRVQFTLGRAQLAAGRPAEARAALDSALAHFDATVGAEHKDSRRTRDLLATLHGPSDDR